MELVGEGLFDLLNLVFTDFYRVFDIQMAAGKCCSSEGGITFFTRYVPNEVER